MTLYFCVNMPGEFVPLNGAASNRATIEARDTLVDAARKLRISIQRQRDMIYRTEDSICIDSCSHRLERARELF